MDALGRTAALFRTFGEDYHERALEEEHVFVPLIKAGGQTAALARTLTTQHQRGREITDYIAAVAKRGRPGADASTTFAITLTTFVRMYEHHAAIEDTIIFPAWKRAISAAQYDELSQTPPSAQSAFLLICGSASTLPSVDLLTPFSPRDAIMCPAPSKRMKA